MALTFTPKCIAVLDQVKVVLCFELGIPMEHQHTGAAVDFSYDYGLVAL